MTLIAPKKLSSEKISIEMGEAFIDDQLFQRNIWAFSSYFQAIVFFVSLPQYFSNLILL